MSDLNEVRISGQISCEPSIKISARGTESAMVVIAVANDGREPTLVTAWAYRAYVDHIRNNFKRGDRIIIEGTLVNRDSIGKDGINRRKTEVWINRIIDPGYQGAVQQAGTAGPDIPPSSPGYPPPPPAPPAVPESE